MSTPQPHKITVRISGMTCQHCVNHVTEELSAYDQVEKVEVTLRPKEISSVYIYVKAGEPFGQHEITEAIAEAGDYTIVSIAE